MLPGESGGGARGLAGNVGSRARSVTRRVGGVRKFILAGGAGLWRWPPGRDELFPGKPGAVRQVLFASGRGEYSLGRSGLACEASSVGTGPVFVIFEGYREAATPFSGWWGRGWDIAEVDVGLEFVLRVRGSL